MNNDILGTWQIVEMDLWDKDYIDAEVEGFISFFENNTGEFQFGYVQGYMNLYNSKFKNSSLSFTWEGCDEMDEAHGCGDAAIVGEQLHGEINFHNGELSGFKAIRRRN
ncbi:hypothetical protein JQC92_18525 [Shewanella sp. 202IG2-18]|uniref:hypothetical protein n=1 Tax=Parashewanella hymeniacidonis TaxID=2807618 RepID=UPI001960AEEE|nr:hypothetical protein [Parashewanella hymeniacidonis]MBM7074004.1 hypothetical protein [Parashewanella hymeniacidonis]